MSASITAHYPAPQEFFDINIFQTDSEKSLLCREVSLLSRGLLSLCRELSLLCRGFPPVVPEWHRAGIGPDPGGGCAEEVGDRDRSVEDADGDIVPLFTFLPKLIQRGMKAEKDAAIFLLGQSNGICR